MDEANDITQVVAEFTRLNARLKLGSLTEMERVRWRHLKEILVRAQLQEPQDAETFGKEQP